MDTTKSKTPAPAISAGIVLMRLADDRSHIESQIQDQIGRVLAEGGSWTTVGVALGVSKQAAQQRYGRLRRDVV